MKLFFSFLLLTLFSNVNAQNSISVAQTFGQYIKSNSYVDPSGTAKEMVSFNIKQETEGSPYLLNNWAKGMIYLKDNTPLKESDYVLNFDKTKNALIMKASGQNVIEIDMDKIASFTLEDNSAAYTLTRMPQAGFGYLMEVYNGGNYSLYKTLNTKFYKSDYVNKGLYETGYKYDRYVDENKYFIRGKNGNLIPVGTTKKELKQLITALPEAKTYIEKNEISSTDLESSLKKMLIALN